MAKNAPVNVRSLIEELKVAVPGPKSSQSRIDVHFGEYPDLLNEILAAHARHVSYETIAEKLNSIAPQGVSISGGVVSSWVKKNKGKTFS